MKKPIFELCNYSVQCNGTENANVFKEYGGKMLCYCANGYLEDKVVCRQVIFFYRLSKGCFISLLFEEKLNSVASYHIITPSFKSQLRFDFTGMIFELKENKAEVLKNTRSEY